MKKLRLAVVVALFGWALDGCGSANTQPGNDGGGAGALAGATGSSGVGGSAGGAGTSAGGTAGGAFGVAGQGGSAVAGVAGTTDGGTGSGGAGPDGGPGGAGGGGGLAGAGGQAGAVGGAAGSGGSGAGGQAATGGTSGAAGSSVGPVNGLLARYYDAAGKKLAERVEQMPESRSVRDHIMMAPFDMSANVVSITWDGWINTSRPKNLAFIGFGAGDARHTITIDDSLTTTGTLALVPFKLTGWHKIHLGIVPSNAAGFLNARPSLFFQTNTSIVPNPDELSATQPF